MSLSLFRLAFLGLLLTVVFPQACSSKLESQLISETKRGSESVTQASTLTQKQDRDLAVTKIAKQVTVRILTGTGSGSGVVIARKGDTYTVLTCQHVVQGSQGSSYRVLSADGRTHTAQIISTPSFKEVDLALVQFESKLTYQVAVLGKSNTLSLGESIYATGFPNYHFINQNSLEDTRNWGTRAFRLTKGKVSLLLERSLPQGYRLGYTNEVELGMSGGPVLNERGEVVGINGRLKYPVQGIDVYTFADGTKPSVELFQQMEALSWAIPIATFRQASDEGI